MSDFDLDRLGDVWRQQPEPAEMARLQRIAANVSRRARYAQIVDVGAAMLVSAVVILLVLSNPKTETVLMGTAAIMVLLYGNFRQRKIRQVELRSLTGTTEHMLDQSIERVEATIKHSRVSLIGIVPTLIVGLAFAAVAQGEAVISLQSAIRSNPTVRSLLFAGAVAVLIGAMVFFYQSIRRNRRELERLQAMRQAYREEGESTLA